MQTKILGGGNIQPGTEAVVDPLYGSMRVVQKPLDYTWANQVLGHYAIAAPTGITVSIGAAGILSYLRNSDTSRFIVIEKVRVQAVIASTITTGVVVDVGLKVSRGATAAGSGGTLPTVGGNNQKLRVSMGASLVTDVRFATTGALVRPTGATVDSNALAYYLTPLSFNIQSPGTATFVPASCPPFDLYKWDANSEHPIVLSPGEVLEVQEITAGPTTGGIQWGITYEWAEVVVF